MGAASTAAQNQLLFHILIFMQTCPDTFIRTWVEPQKVHLWLQQHLLLKSFSRCLITEMISFNATAANASQRLPVAAASTQLANLQNQNLSDMMCFIVFELKVYNILYLTVILGFEGFSNNTISIISHWSSMIK